MIMLQKLKKGYVLLQIRKKIYLTYSIIKYKHNAYATNQVNNFSENFMMKENGKIIS